MTSEVISMCHHCNAVMELYQLNFIPWVLLHFTTKSVVIKNTIRSYCFYLFYFYWNIVVLIFLQGNMPLVNYIRADNSYSCCFIVTHDDRFFSVASDDDHSCFLVHCDTWWPFLLCCFIITLTIPVLLFHFYTGHSYCVVSFLHWPFLLCFFHCYTDHSYSLVSFTDHSCSLVSLLHWPFLSCCSLLHWPFLLCCFIVALPIPILIFH